MTDRAADRNGMGRRDFLRMALGLGIGIPAIASLPSCTRGGGGGALGGGGGGGEVKELIIATNRSPWLGAYQKVAAQYEQESGIKATLREFPLDGLRTQMINDVRNKSQAFDVFQPGENWAAEFYANGWVTPLKEIDSSFSLDSQIITYDSALRWDESKKTFASGGEVMALPLQGNAHLFMYRKDLYDEIGLSVPKTWDEAVANGRKAQQSGKVRFGHVPRAQASADASITYDFLPVFYSFGANWFADEGTDWRPTVNSDAAVAAVEMYRELARLGPDQPQTVGQAEVIAAMQSGEALQTQAVAAVAPQLEDQSKSRVAGKMGYAVVPAGPAGRPTPASGIWLLAVPTGLPKERAEAAYKFIQWMMSPSTQLKFTQAGGIPTRKDTFASDEVPAQPQAYLEPLAASEPYFRRHIRYEFSSRMLEVTEPTLSELVAGSGPVKPSLDRMQAELTKIVRDAGYLK
jgi:multiple sugar transport system substrate-binding protein